MSTRSILHPAPAASPWRTRHTWRLPGTTPVDPVAWLRIDDAYGGQMAERRALLRDRPKDVLALTPEAVPAAQDLLEAVLTYLSHRPEFVVTEDAVTTPDHSLQPIDRADPLATLGRIVQEDFCLLFKAPGADEHRLAGAVLCFPSGWTLAEKMGRPLGSIHIPIDSYTDDIARRVQRLCDAVTWDRPLTRANAHRYDFAQLYDPCSEADPRREKPAHARYLRVERQVLRRLPRTGAVVFSIHTSLTPMDTLSPEDKTALLAAEKG